MLLPICAQFLYANKDPRMRTAIPICIILHMGIQDLISHMETISLCIRLVTEISPYAYRHLTNPRMHTGIMSHAVPVCIQWSSRSPYAYRRSQFRCFRTKLSLTERSVFYLYNFFLFTYMSTFSKKSSQKISDQTESCGKNHSLFVPVRKEIVNRN